MKTMTVTQTVVRTSHATQEISVELPEGSTADLIREALLEKAANTVFTFGNSAEYQLHSEIGKDEGTKAKADVRWILDELVKLGFHRDEDISGVEAVDVMKIIFDDLTSGVHRPATYEPHFIYSQPEDAFWSNSDGWVDLESATPFFERPKSLPVLSGDGVRIVTAEQADVISQYWNQGEETPAGEKA